MRRRRSPPGAFAGGRPQTRSLLPTSRCSLVEVAPAAEALAEISARAATLDEILDAGGLGASSELTEQMLEAWAATCVGGDREAFARRLGWDRLDAGRVSLALQSPPPVELAAWTPWLARFLDAAAACASEFDARGRLAEWPAPATPDEPPFVELLTPPLRAARAELRALAGEALAGFAAAAVADLERQLLKELAHASELAFLEFLQAFQRTRGTSGSYQGFVRAQLSAGLPLLYRALPVLARAQAELVAAWCGTTAELCGRLARDLPDVTRVFGGGGAPGPVAAVEAGLSDRHDGGRRVSILRFVSGLRVVYKPRDVGLEVDFQALLAWARAEGLSALPRPLVVLERPGYGFVEWAAAEPCAGADELAAYHAAAGGLLFAAHLLRARDLHNENLIAARGGPALIDAEAFAQPADVAESGPADALDRTAALRAESCLATGLLTMPQVDATGAHYDIGGLRASPARRAPLARRVWHGQRTDALGFTADDRSPARTQAAVHAAGRPVAPEAYAAEIAHGFAQAYRFFQERSERLFVAGGPLSRLGARSTRLIFRPSDQYAMLLHVLDAPRYQRSGFRRSIAIDMLNRVFAREAQRPRLWPLTAEERVALDGHDIPRFALPLDAVEPVARSGERVPGLFARSGLEAVQQRAARLSEVDLEAQLEWIASALQPEPLHAHAGPEAQGTAGPELAQPDAAPPFRDAAIALGAELLRRAVRGQDGIAWRGLADADGSTDGELDLYDGLGGVALFLAALARHTSEERFGEAARAAVSTIESALARAPASRRAAGGALSGAASIAAALGHAGRALGDAPLHERAVSLLLAANAGAGLDVADGAAGRLLVALALDAGRTGDALRPLATALAEQLCRCQIASGADAGGWPAGGGRARTGYAHGAAGIGLALALAAAAMEREDWLAAARRSFSFVSRSYDPATRNWPLVRDDGGQSVLTAWCHGAAGIALACAALPAAARDEDTETALARAIETTAKAAATRHDHVCCGTLGRAEALLVAGIGRGQDGWMQAGLQLAAGVARRVRGDGSRGARPVGYEAGPSRPGFFQGLSGIGHALLRASDPARVESVLAPAFGGD